MIRFGRRTRADSAERRTDTLTELERLIRRLKVGGLAAPLLLLAGLGLGRLAVWALTLPDDVPVRIQEGLAVPRAELERLSDKMAALREDGRETAESIVLYRDHVAPVERALLRRGVPDSTARRVAWPLVEYAYRQGVDPATVVSVLIVESSGRPHATSPVGARGLMQVMPFWTGHWRDCGHDLYDIDDNLCNGISILALYLDRHGGNERRALLAYNGCVNGSTTPDCFNYPDKVEQIRRRIRAEWRADRAVETLAAAP
ncbi:MAG TPA: lytic transglycosylase domain-containing protein [Longimicrobiales bacterium]